MMQQFATSTSKIAVNSLNIDLNNNESSAKNFGGSINDSRSAFEKAIIDAEQSDFVRAGDFPKSHGFDEKVRTQPVIREVPETRAKSAALDAKTGQSQSEKLAASDDVSQTAVSEQTAKSFTEDNTATDSLVAAQSTQNSSEKAAALQENQVQQSEIASQIEMQGENSREVLSLLNHQEFGIQDDAFDYINFVTQIQDLNEIASLETAVLSEGATENEQSLDLLNISLSEEELQVILDAQQAGLDLKDSLSEEQLLKLSDAIYKMLSQYRAHNQSKEENAAQGEISSSDNALDAKLLETMIAGGAVDGQNDNLIQLVEKQQAENQQELSHLASVDFKGLREDTAFEAAELGATANAAGLATELIAATDADLKISASLNATQADELLAKNQASLINPDTTENVGNGQVGLNVADAVSDEANEVISNAVSNAISANTKENQNSNSVQVANDKENTQNISKQIAMLDERSQTNIIDNIKSRVEKFIDDLSGNSSKGSEFVAAMQAGLKEFKAQLQSGREPGIDLKALVSDALAQANVEISTQAQTKVDTTLNQISGLMNLANTVNQSSQAQAQQLFGSPEAQMIKESNAIGAEGTKLAQQASMASDKAINIFKAEGQQQIAEKVRWMISARNPAAEIRFDPPELGSMQIKINMSADTAAVSFTVQSVGAKEAIDQALPKLRDMLQEQGIELGQSSVEQQNKGQSEQNNEQHAHSQSGSGNMSGLLADEQSNDAPQMFEQRISGGSIGGIDYYA